MKTNNELMKRKWAALRGQLKGGDENSVWFKPTEGTTDIRIVPAEDGDPLKEKHFHWIGQGQSKKGILCPKRNFGEDCPICEFASSMWREGVDNNDQESKNLAKSLFVRTRYFSPVVVRGREEEGVKVYGYGKQAYELLLGYFLDTEYGDIADVDEGTDIALTYTKPTKKGEFPRTSLKMRRKTSPLLEDGDAVSSLLDRMPNIDALHERLSPKQVKAIMDEEFFGDGSAEELSSETVKYGHHKNNDVDRAFDELRRKTG
tara:strand:+ start:1923 stop:2702 length:780 start_codon:yes stop_codon:yes gene_type:complete